MDAIFRRVVSFVGAVLEVNWFSFNSGSLRSIKVKASFDTSKSLILGLWIPYSKEYVCVEFKYEKSPKFIIIDFVKFLLMCILILGKICTLRKVVVLSYKYEASYTIEEWRF